jgi:hypothetical protein
LALASSRIDASSPAILAKGAEPVSTRRGLQGDPADTQSRYLEAVVNGVLIASIYAPTAGDKTDETTSKIPVVVCRAGTTGVAIQRRAVAIVMSASLYLLLSDYGAIALVITVVFAKVTSACIVLTAQA